MYNKINDIIFLQSINPNNNITCDLTSTAFEKRQIAVEEIKWLKSHNGGEKAINEEKKNKERAELEIYKYIQYLKKRYDGIEFLNMDCTEILNEFLKNEVIQ